MVVKEAGAEGGGAKAEAGAEKAEVAVGAAEARPEPVMVAVGVVVAVATKGAVLAAANVVAHRLLHSSIGLHLKRIRY